MHAADWATAHVRTRGRRAADIARRASGDHVLAAAGAAFEVARPTRTRLACFRVRHARGESGRKVEHCADAFVRGKRLDHVEAMLPTKFAWARLGAPELRQRVKLTHDEVKAAYAAAVRQQSLVFFGGQGSGKTSIAVALLRWSLEAGRKRDASKADYQRARNFVFAPAYGLARDRARHKLGDGEAPLVEAAIAASIAVIDELGSEVDGQLSAVSDVVYERHGNDRPTWVTTWLTPDEVVAKYGGGIARRIYEGAHVLEVGSRVLPGAAG